MTSEHAGGTRERILVLLRRHGRLSAPRLAELLQLTSVGVRRHLALLERDGLVGSSTEKPRRGRPTAVYRLTDAGIRFGARPAGIWAPECGYRPASVGADGVPRPGLEDLLSELGLNLFFAETHAVIGGRPLPGLLHPEMGHIRIPRPRSFSHNAHLKEVAACSAELHELLLA